MPGRLSTGGVILQGGVADTSGSESARSHAGGVAHYTAPRLRGEFSRLGASSCEGRDQNGTLCLSVQGMGDPPPPPQSQATCRAAGATGFMFPDLPEGRCIIDVEGANGAVGSAG